MFFTFTHVIWNPYVTQIVSLGYLWAQQILWCRLPFFWISVLPRLGRATGISKTKSLNKVDETLSGAFICVFSHKLLLKVIYHWINMFKPVMHLFCWSAAIFKLFQKHKGPSRTPMSTKGNSCYHSQPNMRGTKTVLLIIKVTKNSYVICALSVILARTLLIGLITCIS